MYLHKDDNAKLNCSSADCGRSFTRHYPLRFMQFLLSQKELAIFLLSD